MFERPNWKISNNVRICEIIKSVWIRNWTLWTMLCIVEKWRKANWTEHERKKRLVKSPVCKVSKDKQDEKWQRRSTRISQKNFKNVLIHRLCEKRINPRDVLHVQCTVFPLRHVIHGFLVCVSLDLKSTSAQFQQQKVQFLKMWLSYVVGLLCCSHVT